MLEVRGLICNRLLTFHKAVGYVPNSVVLAVAAFAYYFILFAYLSNKNLSKISFLVGRCRRSKRVVFFVFSHLFTSLSPSNTYLPKCGNYTRISASALLNDAGFQKNKTFFKYCEFGLGGGDLGGSTKNLVEKLVGVCSRSKMSQMQMKCVQT